MPSTSPARAPRTPIEAALHDLVESMALVLDNDWEFTRDTLNANPPHFMIDPEGTFLNPKIDDESNNWGNRGGLLSRYRAAVAALQSQGLLDADSMAAQVVGIDVAPNQTAADEPEITPLELSVADISMTIATGLTDATNAPVNCKVMEVRVIEAEGPGSETVDVRVRLTYRTAEGRAFDRRVEAEMRETMQRTAARERAQAEQARINAEREAKRAHGAGDAQQVDWRAALRDAARRDASLTDAARNGD